MLSSCRADEKDPQQSEDHPHNDSETNVLGVLLVDRPQNLSGREHDAAGQVDHGESREETSPEGIH